MTTETTPDPRLRRNVPAPSSSTALKGAALAFGKPAVKPKPQANTYAGNNGALAAATSSSKSSSSRNMGSNLEASVDHEGRLVYQRSGRSATSTPDQERRFTQEQQARSPSFIAATLAASRSVTPNHTGQQQNQSAAAVQRESSSNGRAPSVRSMSSRGSSEQRLDTTSIPPTNSLIGMFEQNAKQQLVKKKKPVVQRLETLEAGSESPKASVLPTPVRVRRPSPLVDNFQDDHVRSPSPSPLAKKVQKPEVRPRSPSLVRKLQKQEINAPTLTPARSLGDKPPEILKPKPKPARKTPVSEPAKPTISKPTISKPIPIPSPSKPREHVEVQNEDDDASSSNDSFVSASEFSPSFRVAVQNQRLQRIHSASPNSLATIDAMANAIVASSLASSRAASPMKSFLSPYAPPPPPRRNPHKHLFHSKTPPLAESPQKVSSLRTTMRKPRADSEVDEAFQRRGRKKMMRKHPNKHHEGDRKRWRDEITERERKRYEAVWASNKGAQTPPGLESCVCNLIVRDIWSRSRLSPEVLEEVYALVDRTGRGVLDREEFAVGLWLIDQRLKGRKLPIRVGRSVWASVSILGGIKVRRAK